MLKDYVSKNLQGGKIVDIYRMAGIESMPKSERGRMYDPTSAYFGPIRARVKLGDKVFKLVLGDDNASWRKS